MSRHLDRGTVVVLLRSLLMLPRKSNRQVGHCRDGGTLPLPGPEHPRSTRTGARTSRVR